MNNNESNQISRIIRPEGDRYPDSKYDLVMKDLLTRQASGRLFIPGNPIIKGALSSGWSETCTIVTSPINPILNPEKLNDFMFSLTEVPYTSVDRAYRGSERSDLSIPKLYFDEVLGEIVRKISSTVIQRLSFNSDLRIDVPEEEERTDLIQRRTWLYVYPDPSSAEVAHQVMNGELQPDLSVFSEYHLTPAQINMIKKNNRIDIGRRLFGGK